ncbi:MAG: cysteine--tRNA ligase, partial [Deltaproteobacteria bacterium]|nr:cysteine--tRNA ligase [Deltaproteobacteria bacterium]
TICTVAEDLKTVCGVLNIITEDPETALLKMRDHSAKLKNIDPAFVEKKIEERNIARAEKEWAKSDAVRDELLEISVELRDGPQGTSWSVIR